MSSTHGEAVMTMPRAGEPIWWDLGTTDLPAARRFYGELFGWSADVSSDPDTAGYTQFRKDGKLVAGAGEVSQPGQPTSWTMYVATDDAEALPGPVESTGGTTLMPPMDILPFGRMAIFADPTGAVFGVWQSGTHHGAELRNEPGSVFWTELATRDVPAAKGFYGPVFDWDPEDMPSGPLTYTTWWHDDTPVAGALPMEGDMWPPEVPPHWMTYFSVDDCEATVVRAEELGGQVVVPPTDIPPGRMAVITDPQGGAFSVITLNDETRRQVGLV
jgi:uncharacterized protein